MSKGLKQRIVGSLVLALIGFLLFSWLFNFTDPKRVDRNSLIPPAPDIKAADIAMAKRPKAVNAKQQVAPIFDVNKSFPAAKDDANNFGLNASGLPNAWVLQVASFEEQSLADELTDSLRAQQFKAFKKTVEIAGKMVHRVYIGPKLDKRQAFADKAKIDKLLATDSIVLKYAP